jgi:hypothetical protein
VDAMLRHPCSVTVFIIETPPRADTNAAVTITGRPTISEDFPMTAGTNVADARGTNADQM